MPEKRQSSTGGPRFDLSALTSQEQQVGHFAAREPLRFATSSVADIAEWTGTSQATVIRTSRRLGFSGIKQMKAACAAMVEDSRDLPGLIKSRLTELPATFDGDSAAETVHRVVNDSAKLIMQLGQELDSDSFASAISALESGSRIAVYGLGSAWGIAQYAALAFERVGLQTAAITGVGFMNADNLLRLRDDDVLLVIAPRIIYPDIQVLVEQGIDRVSRVIVAAREFPQPEFMSRVVHLRLPGAVATAASESVAAWVLVDVMVAELARRHPDLAVATSSRLEGFRQAASGRARGY